MRQRLVLVDRDLPFRTALERELTARCAPPETVELLAFDTPDAALDCITSDPSVDVLLLELRRFGGGEDAFRHPLFERRLPWLLLLDQANLKAAAAVDLHGGSGFLIKPFSPLELLDELRELASKRRDREVGAASFRGIRGIRGIVGRHPRMLELHRAIDNVSELPTSTTVLIQGESGTGKELVARAIHESSSQARGPFVGVNCAAFSASLLDDQLFGHVRGAFTGAATSKSGVFVSASHGTLFLDEITEMDPGLQAKFLRAIQEREVYPLGADGAVPWDARLIVATNRDLEAAVDAGVFRRDLYYRVNVVRLDIPPLRERQEDVPRLAEHFLDELAPSPARRKRLSRSALEHLSAYDYPGNVRQLRNALERACALGSGPTVLPEDLPAEFRERRVEAFQPLADVERAHLIRALRLAEGKKVQAARILQIDRNRLYRMIKRHGIRPEEMS